MSGSLLAMTFIVACMIVFWRVTLLVVVAVMIALLASGLGYVSAALQANPPPAQTVPAPGGGPTSLQVGDSH